MPVLSPGETVKLASVDQFRDAMDNSKTVWEEVSGGLDIMKIGNTEMPSRAYVGRFNFKGVDRGKRVGELSGGERGRLHLAKLLQVGGNVLLLDEPTNDLDIETLRALENALLEFPDVRWLSRMTVGSSTVSRPTFWITGMKVKSSSSKVTSPSTKSTRNAPSAPMRWSQSVSSTSVLRSNKTGGPGHPFFMLSARQNSSGGG